MVNKRFYSGKTYTHATGHSCAFRQWKADSHCNLIHGYALQFELKFGSNGLDEKNWVVDFGGLKPLKQWLAEMFDHTYLVAEDDPELETFKELEQKNLCDLRIVPAVGCERFAEMVFDKAQDIISIDLKDKSSMADYMIIASGTSSRHIQALSEQVLEKLKKRS